MGKNAHMSLKLLATDDTVYSQWKIYQVVQVVQCTSQLYLLRKPEYAAACQNQSILTPLNALLLLAWSDQMTPRPRIVRPPSGQSRTTSLLRKVLHPLLKLRSEVTNKTLDGPCKSLTKSYT